MSTQATISEERTSARVFRHGYAYGQQRFRDLFRDLPDVGIVVPGQYHAERVQFDAFIEGASKGYEAELDAVERVLAVRA